MTRVRGLNRVAHAATYAGGGSVFREPNTNTIPNPQAFDLWTQTSGTMSLNAVADPEGAMTGELWTDVASGTTTAVAVTSAAPVGITTSAVHRASVYVKAGTAPWVRLAVNNMGALVLTAYFDVATGAAGNKGANVTASGSDGLVNGWRRYWMTFNSDVADTACVFQISMTSANNVTTIFRDGTKTMNLWLAQLAAV